MSITDLLNQSVIVYPKGTRNKFNELSWGEGVTYKARFQKTSKVIVTPQNEREPIDGYVDINLCPIAEIGGKLVYSEENYKIMSIKTAIDGDGQVHHVTLLVQKWSTG